MVKKISILIFCFLFIISCLSFDTVIWLGKKELIKRFSYSKDLGIIINELPGNQAKFSLVESKKWGKAFIEINNFDLDIYPCLDIEINKIEESSNVQIKATSDWVKEYTLLERFTSDKLLSSKNHMYRLPLKEKTGWEGKKNIILVFYLEGSKNGYFTIGSIIGKNK